ncbi:MAG: hypothetical protein RLZZ232_3156, partial [Planctomycetota bacterium]
GHHMEVAAYLPHPLCPACSTARIACRPGKVLPDRRWALSLRRFHRIRLNSRRDAQRSTCCTAGHRFNPIADLSAHTATDGRSPKPHRAVKFPGWQIARRGGAPNRACPASDATGSTSDTRVTTAGAQNQHGPPPHVYGSIVNPRTAARADTKHPGGAGSAIGCAPMKVSQTEEWPRMPPQHACRPGLRPQHGPADSPGNTPH